ncbi:MAG TPA: cation:proton antiporter [Usitatibacter sp.]|nr:cation:proton antiporter [Usitatibacter sp.]
MNLSFLPTLPFQLSYPLLFGVLLVAGMLGGEAARSLKLPRIIGYVLVGFILAPLAQAMNIEPLIDEARIFVDLALGLVLFDLGRRMDLKWMKRDWTLAASGLAESVLTFAAVFATLIALDFAAVKAGIAAAIAIATSPAVVLLVVQDTRSEGQVTERALNLVALNSLLASILVTILLAAAHYEARVDVETTVLHPLYLFAGSLLLGAAMTSFARVVARLIDKTKDLHFTLIAGLVVAAVGIATLLKLSVILSLLAFGLFARNDERSYELLNVSLGPASRLLYIVLFVITGASLPLPALLLGGWAALAFVAARTAGKLLGVLVIAPIGGLRMRQALGLGCALLPMSSLALMLQHDIAKLFPEFGQQLTAVFLGAVIIMEILGPLAVQWGLTLAGETEPLAPRASSPAPVAEARATKAPGA